MVITNITLGLRKKIADQHTVAVIMEIFIITGYIEDNIETVVETDDYFAPVYDIDAAFHGLFMRKITGVSVVI